MRTLRHWVTAARRLELAYTSASGSRPHQMRGSIDGFGVRIDRAGVDADYGDRNTALVSVEHPQIPTSLGIASERQWSLVDATGTEVEVGDDAFDHEVKLRGDVTTILATFDHQTRLAVGRLVRDHGGHVRDGRLVSRYLDTSTFADDLVAHVRRLLVIVERLIVAGRDPATYLSRNAVDDPLPSVQLANLRTLHKISPRSRTLQATARACLGNENPELRLAAAEIVGPKADPNLVALATDLRGGPRIRIRALEALSSRLPRADLEALIRQTLEGAPVPVLRAAIHVAEARHLTRVAPSIAALAHHERAAVAADATAALAVLCGRSIAHLLVAQLDHDATDVKVAALRALAAVGTLEHVEAVVPYTRGLFKDTDLKRVARQTIQAIQERGDGGPGRLSLIDGDTNGALSESPLSGSLAITSHSPDD